MRPFLDRLAPVWTPHPGQREFLEHPARIKVLACGRRWGKTDVCAVQTVFALHRTEPTRHLILAPTLDQAALLFERVVALLEALFELEGREEAAAVKRTPYPWLRLGPHRVIARSGHVGRSLRGNEATHLVVDEAAYLPEATVTEVAMPMLATTNGELALIGTPSGLNHFWRFFEYGRSGEHGVWSRTGPSSESPHVSREFLAIQRELISERGYAVEYEARFIEAGGSVFRGEAIEAAVSPVRRPLGRRDHVCIGVDWGLVGDETAVCVLAGTQGDAFLVAMDRFCGQPWLAQVERVAQIAERYPGSQLRVDGTGLGSGPSEFLHARLPGHGFLSVTFSAAAKAALIQTLAKAFETNALRLPPDPELLRQLRSYRATPLAGGSLRYAAAGGHHDDLVAALALALAGLPALTTGPTIQLGTPRAFLS
ncbi:MAG: hypothetical protein KIS66_05510 [Fimbriimonadaceae bacterium]|nr:hypothetical protein [Fimbriimonadaceae bacterium]